MFAIDGAAVESNVALELVAYLSYSYASINRNFFLMERFDEKELIQQKQGTDWPKAEEGKDDAHFCFCFAE